MTRESVAALRMYHRNPRRGDVASIRRSLIVNGQYRPLVVNRGTHTGRAAEVLAGNHTLMAARDEGWPDVAVCWVDVDDDQAARIVATDNRTADLADYDERLLAELLADLPDLDGTGYDPGDLDELIRGLADDEQMDGQTEPDAAPPVPPSPHCTVGDVWLLGPHRLAIGDAADAGTWATATNGRLADIVWTDPPYGVDYVGKTKDALRLRNDTLNTADLRGLLRAVFGIALISSREGACWYVTSPPGPLMLEFGATLADLGVWRQTLTWIKDQFVLGRSDYHYRHEPVFYGWTPGAAHCPPPDRTQDTVHEIARPKASKDHPTMKPVELIEKHLCNSSQPGSLVVDPFAGSGSTLIAAHRNQRIAALIELDPRYGDVICRRFQEHTGIVPIHEGTGEPHDFRIVVEQEDGGDHDPDAG